MIALATAAARYASFGFAVLPCHPREKMPVASLVPRGFRDASEDTATVSRWWRRTPAANVGLVPGSAGFVVLDLDDGEAADLARVRFGIDHRTHPCVAETARGWHLYFRYRGVDLGQRKLAPSIDVRATAGYVLAPPSVHPSGVHYRWRAGASLRAAPELPESVVRVLLTPPDLPRSVFHAGSTRVEPDARVAAYVRRLPTGLADGGGRKRIAHAFARFLTCDIGLSEDVAWSHLVAWNQQHAQPLSAFELRRKLREAGHGTGRAA